MNQLFNLAENMQAESEQLKQFMTQLDQKTLDEIKKLLEISCQKKESSTENYTKQVEKKIDHIFEHSKKAIDSMTRYRISKTLKFSAVILSVMVVFIAGMGGVAYWTGDMVKDNAQKIIQQNEVLKLEGVRIVNEDGKNFLVAPLNLSLIHI